MSVRVIGFPANPSLNDGYQGWIWDGVKWVLNDGGGVGGYDDTEVRGLIATNASDVSDNSARIDELEVSGGGGGGFWVEESPGVIKYTGTAKAADIVSTG